MSDDGPGRLRLTGLHHVTAISHDLERTSAFYEGILGLTLAEREASADDPDARHFWFGDAAGRPGTLVSFLEYPDLADGTPGPGAAHHFAFGVGSLAELQAWVDWLRSRDIDCTAVLDRGRFSSIYLHDPDGHIVELATAATP